MVAAEEVAAVMGAGGDGAGWFEYGAVGVAVDSSGGVPRTPDDDGGLCRRERDPSYVEVSMA